MTYNRYEHWQGLAMDRAIELADSYDINSIWVSDRFFKFFFNE